MVRFSLVAQMFAGTLEHRREGFDREAEIVKSEEGTLASRRSLLKQSGKQVGKDADASLDNARDAVKDLLKRK